jgi:hypothetical protein
MAKDIRRQPLADADLTEALARHVAEVPATRGKPEKPPRTVQVNFAASPDFARLIAKLARDAGSTRRLIARLIRDAGHPVPHWDTDPVSNRREWD